jgi:hypothetical protein
MTTVKFTIESDKTIDLENAIGRLLRIVQNQQPVTLGATMVLNIEAQLNDGPPDTSDVGDEMILEADGWDDWPLDRSKP